MIKNVKPTSGLGDAPERGSKRQETDGENLREHAPSGSRRPGQEEDYTSHRLVIEEDDAGGPLFYRMIDRATGRVLSEVSRDDVEKMMTDPFYTAGKVIDTKA
jgi:hypothetical protein